jgi:hypothetical protein
MTSGRLDPLRRPLRYVRARWDRVGVPQAEDRVVAEAAAFWTDPRAEGWRPASHWHDGLGGLWDSVGEESLRISERLVRVTGRGLPAGRTIDWGAGGGANAVAFAPRCEEFVAADVVRSSIEECARQVRRVCDTPVRTELIDIVEPEAVAQRLGSGSCDLFLCFYVFELLPSKAYGARVLAIAADLLRPGGVAVVQVKYATADVETWSRRRAYRRGLAAMTTYGIDEFWRLSTRQGLTPRAIELVPSNELDQRYAYYLLTKPEEGGTGSRGATALRREPAK